MFYGVDLAKADGLSLHVCAPYGNYDVELDIFGDTGKISGDIGVKVFQGLCQVRANSGREMLESPTGRERPNTERVDGVYKSPCPIVPQNVIPCVPCVFVHSTQYSMNSQTPSGRSPRRCWAWARTATPAPVDLDFTPDPTPKKHPDAPAITSMVWQQIPRPTLSWKAAM